MNSFVTISFAFLALSSASEILQGPSVKNVNLGIDGAIIQSLALGGNVLGGVQPIVSGIHVPILKNVHPYGPVVGTTITPLTTGIQGPSSKTISVGPDGSVIDSYTAGGIVSDDGTVLVSPALHQNYHHEVVPNSIHTVVPGTNTVYAPGFYSKFVPIPYAKSLVSDASVIA